MTNFSRDFPAGEHGWGTRVVAGVGEVEVFTTGPYTGRYPHKPMSLDQAEDLAIGTLEAVRTARRRAARPSLRLLKERMQDRASVEESMEDVA
jgi:hypothetical protein